MQINWTNCADEMPPDDAEIIVSACGYFTIHEGSDLKRWLSTDHVKWTEYTPEKMEMMEEDKTERKV